MPTDHRRELARIKRFDQLVEYLRDEMGWPIESEDFEDLTFDYEPEELGIDAANAAKIQEIKRLRPLSANQPWGIFFVNFEPKRLPVVALRRILSRVVLKKRAAANSAERAAWQMSDLLFISNYGDDTQRRISFAHFVQDDDWGDLPTLKVLGWDGDDTNLHLDDIARKLTTKLRWPDDEDDVESWRSTWADAFVLRHREVITTSKLLAERLADLARKTREKANAALAIEAPGGPLRKLMDAFKKSLIHNLDEDGFADVYAQTIAYGLLSVRISHRDEFSADKLLDMVSPTNPFLKEMMQHFLRLGGRRRSGQGWTGIDFDELGINEIVQLLRDANMEAVILDFGDRNRQEDPVIHFYESFLKEYDAKKRMQRGVFYTPRPVVSYIVRSVHELLQTEFGLADGLADTTTWGEMLAKHPGLKLPPLTDSDGETETISPDEPFVQILDPATGTATFLVEAIDLIHETLLAKWKVQRLTETERKAAWNDYVPNHLLPRLHAYELMMAPYAIAHMKIGLKLAETGYRFGTEERARVYLTNALEPWMKQLPLIGFEALAHEAESVNQIKRSKRFTVIVGNPPYAGISANTSAEAIALVDAYKFVNGEPLSERKHWLQDDYKKFFRAAQLKIHVTGVGVLGYITNHGYMDDPTARGMRHNLLTSFARIHLLDAHGSLKKREVCPDGTADENVFEIEPGVSVGFFVRTANQGSASTVKHADLWGLSAEKLRFFSTNRLATTSWDIVDPRPRFYLFVPSDTSLTDEYEYAIKLEDIFSASSVGCVTARDRLTIHWTAEEVWQTVTDFASVSVETARAKYELGKDVRDWTVEGAQRDIRASGPDKSFVVPLLYRPFDRRFTYYTGQSRGFIGQPQPKVMKQFLCGNNLGLSVGRAGKAADADAWNVVFCTRLFTEFNLFRRGGNKLHPLYIFPIQHAQRELAASPKRVLNFTQSFLKSLAQALDVPQSGKEGLPQGVTPRDIFSYIYAVFHSPAYRERYAEFLKVDFPRLPLVLYSRTFFELVDLGKQIVALHLLESPVLADPITEFFGKRNPKVEKLAWSQDTVWLDKSKTVGFKGVPEDVWNFFIGGYQVCEKWLKDRKGRVLFDEDVAHYQKIVVAIDETIDLMAEIDGVIEASGGWARVFVTGMKEEYLVQDDDF